MKSSLLFATSLFTAQACTNYLITPGASTEGTLISYAADSGAMYGTLGFYAAADHQPGAVKEIYDWDSGNYLGTIPQPPHTYKVVGNTNEFQLTIAETTFGGVTFKDQTEAVMDYGSHIWTTLQRAKNVSEAITVLDQLMQTYGWASEGESFSIGDPNELWIMEIVGKGNVSKGSVWVAQKIPDGAVSGHANQARIRTFDRTDPSTVRYSKDVVDFARSQGLYKGTDEDFSFSDTYDPVGFTGARLAEARVWNMFRQVVDDDGSWGNNYLDYITGKNLTHRFPLYVYPKHKISLNDTMWFMRGQYDGTPLDMTQDVGAQQWAAAVRTRPLYWKSDETGTTKQYHNERPIGTQQTGWHFVAQMRTWLPDAVGGVVWFGVDDTAHSVHVPFFVGVTSIPVGWADQGIQHVDDEQASLAVDWSKAWWSFNIVANFAYFRWTAHVDVQQAIVRAEASFFTAVAALEKQVAPLVATNPGKASAMLTTFSSTAGSAIIAEWESLWKELFFKYRDFFTTSRPTQSGKNHPWPATNQQGFPDKWGDYVVKSTGDKFLVPPTSFNEEIEQRKLRIVGL